MHFITVEQTETNKSTILSCNFPRWEDTLAGWGDGEQELELSISQLLEEPLVPSKRSYHDHLILCQEISGGTEINRVRSWGSDNFRANLGLKRINQEIEIEGHIFENFSWLWWNNCWFLLLYLIFFFKFRFTCEPKYLYDLLNKFLDLVLHFAFNLN